MDNRFVSLRDRGENELGGNLTDMASLADPENGVSLYHPDGVAHWLRYMFAMRTASSTKVARVLDVGCGPLGMTRVWYRNRFKDIQEYWGMDLRVTEAMLNGVPESTPYSVTLVRTDVVLDDPTGIEGWPTEGFDLVTCFEVLEHIPQSAGVQLMQNLYRWTRPGQLCLFSTPNAGMSPSVADNHLDDHGHSREWTYEDKVALVTAVGFTLESAYGLAITVKNMADDLLEDPRFKAIKKLFPAGLYRSALGAATPETANNALMVLRKDAS